MRRASSLHEGDPNDLRHSKCTKVASRPSGRLSVATFVTVVSAALVAFFSPCGARAEPRSAPSTGLTLSISAYASRSLVGWTEGAWLTVTLPFERMARARSAPVDGALVTAVDRLGFQEKLSEGTPPSRDVAVERGPPLVGPRIARKAIATALRVTGLAVDDSSLAALVTRARLSALLPEARFRATRSANDELTFDRATETSRLSGDGGRTLWLEARLTWRFDRLVFVDEELGVERIRVDRIDARTKLTLRVIDSLAKWERAAWDAETSEAGTRERGEAVLAVEEAMLVLEALTGGWFSEWARTLPNVAGAVARNGP